MYQFFIYASNIFFFAFVYIKAQLSAISLAKHSSKRRGNDNGNFFSLAHIAAIPALKFCFTYILLSVWDTYFDRRIFSIRRRRHDIPKSLFSLEDLLDNVTSHGKCKHTMKSNVKVFHLLKETFFRQMYVTKYFKAVSKEQQHLWVFPARFSHSSLLEVTNGVNCVLQTSNRGLVCKQHVLCAKFYGPTLHGAVNCSLATAYFCFRRA